jgi:hypothetical protein
MGSTSTTKPEHQAARSGSIGAALLLGLPTAGGILFVLLQPRFEGTLAHRYLQHPVEKVEICVFCTAVMSLLVKLIGSFFQRRAVRKLSLPAWDGKPLPASEAGPLLAHLARLPRPLRRSWVGQRCLAILDFLHRRGSSEGLDDHVRCLSDNDEMSLDASYSFLGFLVWALPILGFLGTVLGIAESIAGVSPEQLEKGLTSVTSGLALAFDTTGLALGLTLATMFIKFLVERAEQSALQGVHGYIEEHLFHRFARAERGSDPVFAPIDRIVERQAEVWAASMQRLEARLGEQEQKQQERLADALVQAIDRSLTVHQALLGEMRRTAGEQAGAVLAPLTALAGALRQHQHALKPVAQGMTALGQSLARLQEDEGAFLRLQRMLQENLAALSAAGSFEEALHSLTAAIHLLQARSGMKSALRASSGDDPRAVA